MVKSVLVIDDEKMQAVGLSTALGKLLPGVNFMPVYEEGNILEAIENKFFNLAILDLRMDRFSIDGIGFAKKIFEINPFSKILIVSAFTGEYLPLLKELLVTGKVIDVLEKRDFETWVPSLSQVITEYYNSLDSDPSEVNNALLQYYADAKNEIDAYSKGKKFEHFVSLLFSSIGYKDIRNRNKDKSLNEVDLIVRNEIDDNFLNKFGKYILVECKNKPEDRVNKNDFIVFNNKLKNTNGLAELGFLITTGFITWNTYIEAVRTTNERCKVLFISNPEMERLLKSNDKKEEFKRLIDEQVKAT